LTLGKVYRLCRHRRHQRVSSSLEMSGSKAARAFFIPRDDV
jgi:hypothetical protein